MIWDLRICNLQERIRRATHLVLVVKRIKMKTGSLSTELISMLDTSEMQTCRVAWCRHPTTHTTRGHTCGRCDQRGHGARECGMPNRIQLLEKFYNEDLPSRSWCSFNCSDPRIHSYIAHHCSQCGRNGHTSSMCAKLVHPPGQTGILSQIQNTQAYRLLRNHQVGSVVSLPGGMDSLLFYKKVASNGQPMDVILLHPTVGSNTFDNDNLSSIRNFTREREGVFHCDVTKTILRTPLTRAKPATPLTQDESNRIRVRCPLCRTVNLINTNIPPIKGLSDICCICQDASVEVVFEACRHVCVCQTCLSMMQPVFNL